MRRTKYREMFREISEEMIKKHGINNITKTTLKMEGYNNKMATLIMMYINELKKNARDYD